MVSDKQLIKRIHELLEGADLTITTNASVRRNLEEDFGIDLCDRKAFVREQVDIFLQSQYEEIECDNIEQAVKFNSEEEEGCDDEMMVKFELEEESYDGPTVTVKLEQEDASVDPTVNVKKEEAFLDGTVKIKKEEASKPPGGPCSRNGPTKRKRSKKTNGEGNKRGSGFNKLCRLSSQLQEFIGVPELVRTEIVKQVWTYIREKKLQDSNNRQNIICDEPLRSLFGVDSINMFQLNKDLSKHILPLESENGGAAVQPTAKIRRKQKRVGNPEANKRLKQEREDSDEPEQKNIHPKGGKGFLSPFPVSDALKIFLGTRESSLTRADAVKRIWDYIKQNNLKDPVNRKMVKCDEKLKELFGVDTFYGFSVSKLLSRHFIKKGQ